MLKTNHTIARDDMGYEEVFTSLYDKMSDEERKLHRYIRAMTENSMLHINERTQDLVSKIEIENLPMKSNVQVRLSEKLRTLDLHLTLWLAKYQYWIPENPKHALVYMADEEAHGVAFPQDIEKLIAEVLETNQRAQIRS
jgi:ribosome biogenesis protein Nip4